MMGALGQVTSGCLGCRGGALLLKAGTTGRVSVSQ